MKTYIQNLFIAFGIMFGMSLGAQGVWPNAPIPNAAVSATGVGFAGKFYVVDGQGGGMFKFIILFQIAGQQHTLNPLSLTSERPLA